MPGGNETRSSPCLTGIADRLFKVTAAPAEEVAQLRTDATGQREALCAAPESRAQALEESHMELRAPG